MSNPSIHRSVSEVDPDLYAHDIPFSPTGLSRAVVVDVADVPTLRELLSEALTVAARLAAQGRRDAGIRQYLHDEIRALRSTQGRTGKGKERTGEGST